MGSKLLGHPPLPRKRIRELDQSGTAETRTGTCGGSALWAVVIPQCPPFSLPLESILMAPFAFIQWALSGAQVHCETNQLSCFSPWKDVVALQPSEMDERNREDLQVPESQAFQQAALPPDSDPGKAGLATEQVPH